MSILSVLVLLTELPTSNEPSAGMEQMKLSEGRGLRSVDTL